MDFPTLDPAPTNGLTYKFDCECGQEYSAESFNAAIKLYGVFFLVGEKYNFVGTTCLNCKKTIYMKEEGDLLGKNKERLSDFLYLPNEHGFDPDFRYLSPDVHPIIQQKIESGDVLINGLMLSGGTVNQDTLVFK